MIDLVIGVFTGVVFYAGFKAGRRFETIGAMFKHGINWIQTLG